MKQELALPKEYQDALCELKTLSNDLLTTGQIRKIGADFLEITNAMGSSSLKQYVDEVKVIITHKKLPQLVYVGKLYIPTMEFFRVIDVKSVMNEDLRNFFRVNVYTPGIVIAPNEDKESKELTSTHDVTIVDLSLGGAYITTSASLSQSTQVTIVITLDQKPIQLTGIIKRKKNLVDGTFGYGCSFTAMKNSTADVVCKYLFKVQKEIRI